MKGHVHFLLWHKIKKALKKLNKKKTFNHCEEILYHLTYCANWWEGSKRTEMPAEGKPVPGTIWRTVVLTVLQLWSCRGWAGISCDNAVPNTKGRWPNFKPWSAPCFNQVEWRLPLSSLHQLGPWIGKKKRTSGSLKHDLGDLIYLAGSGWSAVEVLLARKKAQMKVRKQKKRSRGGIKEGRMKFPSFSWHCICTDIIFGWILC